MLVTYKAEKTVEVNTPYCVRHSDYHFACLFENGSIMEIYKFNDKATITTMRRDATFYKSTLDDLMTAANIPVDEFYRLAEEARQFSESLTTSTEAI
jgi:hypothetical protein